MASISIFDSVEFAHRKRGEYSAIVVAIEVALFIAESHSAMIWECERMERQSLKGIWPGSLASIS